MNKAEGRQTDDYLLAPVASLCRKFVAAAAGDGGRREEEEARVFERVSRRRGSGIFIDED
jgi:hypothetical protein